MEAIRYTVIHAESGAYLGAFDTLEEANHEAARLNRLYGDGLFVSLAIDKREAELRDAAQLQRLARGHHRMVLGHMKHAAECGDAWELDRDYHLERARGWQRVRARDARRAMELMGVIDPD